MLPRKKIDLSRFKSPSGLREFAMLIEQADPSHREKIIQQTEEQDPELVEEAMRKVVFFDELIYLEDAVLAEILAATPPKVLAFAIIDQPQEFRIRMLKQLNYRGNKLTEEEFERARADHSPAQALGAQKQIVKIARVLEGKGAFPFDVSDCPRLNPGKFKKKA